MSELNLGNQFTYNTDKNEIIVDMDGVLCHIDTKWVGKMHEPANFDYFNKFLRLSKDFDPRLHDVTVFSRPDFYLDKWLVRKDIFDKFSDSEVTEMRERMMSLYNDDDTFYDNLFPTDLGKAIAFTLKQPILKKVTVVSRVTSNNTASKERFIKKLFTGSMNKVDIYFVEKNEKKSDVINNLNGSKINAYYEDEISNVDDVIRNCKDFKDSQLFIPSYGYNTVIPEETKMLAQSKGIEFKYYSVY